MKKILVIDDDDAILDSLRLVLTEAGYKVETVNRGSDTYKKVKDFRPDVIMLDVLMSGSDGRTICKNLKSDLMTKEIPVIMISAHPTAKDGALDFGADFFLAKPFEVDEVLGAVGRFVND